MEIPIIPAEAIKKEVPGAKPLSIPIISEKGIEEYKIRKEKRSTASRSVIPTGDTCCTKVCTIVNNKVKYLEDELLLRESELASITEGFLLKSEEVTRKVPVKVKGEIVKGKIEEVREKVETRVSIAASQTRLKLKKQIHAITNQLESLNDARYKMVEQGSCKCIEEVKFPERKIGTLRFMKV